MIRMNKTSHRDLSVALSAWELIVMSPTTAYCSSEAICLVRECLLQTVSDRAVGHATARQHSPRVGGDHLIRRLCHTHPLPAHSSAGRRMLLIMRSR